jgi:hypothetical protein
LPEFEILSYDLSTMVFTRSSLIAVFELGTASAEPLRYVSRASAPEEALNRVRLIVSLRRSSTLDLLFSGSP